MYKTSINSNINKQLKVFYWALERLMEVCVVLGKNLTIEKHITDYNAKVDIIFRITIFFRY